MLFSTCEGHSKSSTPYEVINWIRKRGCDTLLVSLQRLEYVFRMNNESSNIWFYTETTCTAIFVIDLEKSVHDLFRMSVNRLNITTVTAREHPDHFIDQSYKPLTNLVSSVRTVSYGPSVFFRSLMTQARSARAINQREKNEDP